MKTFEVGKIPEWDEFVRTKLKEFDIQKGSQFEAKLFLAFEETMQLFKIADHQYKYQIKEIKKQLESALANRVHVAQPKVDHITMETIMLLKKQLEAALSKGDSCPHCGTTEMLCGHRGVGCTVEVESLTKMFKCVCPARQDGHCFDCMDTGFLTKDQDIIDKIENYEPPRGLGGIEK